MFDPSPAWHVRAQTKLGGEKRQDRRRVGHGRLELDRSHMAADVRVA